MIRSSLLMKAAIVTLLLTMGVVAEPEKKVNITNLNEDWHVEILSCTKEGKELVGLKL